MTWSSYHSGFEESYLYIDAILNSLIRKGNMQWDVIAFGQWNEKTKGIIYYCKNCA